MKNFYLTRIFIFLTMFILLACSNDDEGLEIQEEFLTAKVDGAEYWVGDTNPIIDCKKHLTDLGSINLAVKAMNNDGRIMEFLILNDRGAGSYHIGNRTYFPGNSFVNGNWMKYSEPISQEIWSTRINEYISDGASLQVITDDGTFLSGTFSFNAQGEVGESIRSISEGNFSIEIDR